ncbi:MAG: endonuclease III [Treponema sp.]|nr:endonuclease III [Treponema sp.]
MKSPPWKSIFTSLDGWRNKTITGSDDDQPAVRKEAFKGIDNIPWAILVATILSLRTKDEVTRSSSQRLLAKATGPAELLSIGTKETARLAYPVGFYNNKAAQLSKIAAILIEKYQGQVPDDLDALLELPGVGRKTANLVLSEAFDIDAICVDIHVHRICNRAGWLSTLSPEETEFQLRKILPRSYWKSLNYLLVFYGQRICRPLSPYCSLCVIPKHCQKIGVEKTR